MALKAGPFGYVGLGLFVRCVLVEVFLAAGQR